MTVDFHELSNVEEVNCLDALDLPRARDLVKAISKQRFVSLVQLLRQVGGTKTFEYIVFDVECDEVPKNNPHGIQYRERLALRIPENSKQLIEVFALRKNFPRLLHQNQTAIGAPASLCLYFEPAPSVLRTWTPENFLRRIQWWLEASSRGELHPADQPVEQMFFVSKYELVLPWNFDELKKIDKSDFIVRLGPERPDKGRTFSLYSSTEAEDKNEKKWTHIELNLTAVVHGEIESTPANLGDLLEILSARDVDFTSNLVEITRSLVGVQGAKIDSDMDFTILLLHIPISRTVEAEPERIDHRAILLPFGSLKLGLYLGALFLHDGKYYRAIGLEKRAPSTEGLAESIFPMEVLRENDTRAAREQSGIKEAGPNGVLIGVGSLGSMMLNLWGRNGWGEWTVVDNDYIKPHNLSRHTAYIRHIGDSKINVAKDLHQAAMGGASNVVALYADACDTSNAELNQALDKAQLVVDASTTLEYPRLSSKNNSAPRHVSVFITPNGNSATLLSENVDRSIRLRTLEAQYYRALINQDWGAAHLEGNLGTFWSGASCRDISTVIPYSRIAKYAAILAEQVQQITLVATPLIRVWSDEDAGAVIVHDVPVAAEITLKFDDLDLSLDEDLKNKLRSMRSQNLPRETGGVLLGYYDLNVNAVVIVDALPAPADSTLSRESFQRGVIDLKPAVEEASKRTAGVVGYLGEWHSHPKGHNANPSRDDLLQLDYLSKRMGDEGLPALSLIVGEHDLQILCGETTR